MCKKNKKEEPVFWDSKWKFWSEPIYLKSPIKSLNKYGWKPSLENPEILEIELGDVYDKIGIPTHNRRGYVWTMSIFDIDRIYFNNRKNTTVVLWKNGDRTKVKMADDESCYIYNAVAAAVMKRRYKSNSAFKSYIEKNLGGYSEAAYLVIAREQTSKIYGGYEKFKAMVDEKLYLQG